MAQEIRISSSSPDILFPYTDKQSTGLRQRLADMFGWRALPPPPKLPPRPDYIPADYERIRIVSRIDRDALLFAPGTDCNLLPRGLGELEPGFNALARRLGGMLTGNERRELNYVALKNEVPHLTCPDALRAAEFIIENDMRPLRTGCTELPRLRLIRHYGTREGELHLDFRKIIAAAYTRPTTRVYRRQDLIRRDDNGSDEVFFDPASGARPFCFAPGDLWVQAGFLTDARTLDSCNAFAHGGSDAPPDGPPRMLLLGFPKYPAR